MMGFPPSLSFCTNFGIEIRRKEYMFSPTFLVLMFQELWYCIFVFCFHIVTFLNCCKSVDIFSMLRNLIKQNEKQTKYWLFQSFWKEMEREDWNAWGITWVQEWQFSYMFSNKQIDKITTLILGKVNNQICFKVVYNNSIVFF